MQNKQVNFKGQKKGNRLFSHPLLFPMFQSSGYLTPSPFTESRDIVVVFAELTIDVIREDQETNDIPIAVYLCPPNFELNNWKAVEIPTVYKLSE